MQRTIAPNNVPLEPNRAPRLAFGTVMQQQSRQSGLDIENASALHGQFQKRSLGRLLEHLQFLDSWGQNVRVPLVQSRSLIVSFGSVHNLRHVKNKQR